MATSSKTLHSEITLLTPMKSSRKKRPSFSHQKSSTPSLKRRSRSEAPQSNPMTPQPELNIATASLDFKEFSFWDPEKRQMKNLSAEDTNALIKYLAETYGAYDVHFAQPFLVLRCSDGIPPQEKRPFSIAGCIAVWLNEGDPTPGAIGIGDIGQQDDITVDDDILNDLRPFCIPKDETLLKIVSKYFPEAMFISMIGQDLILEFPKQSDDSWYEYIQNTTAGFKNCAVSLSYCNGPMVTTELKRLETPKPAVLASIDDSDYVKTLGCFSPGVMLKSDAGQISAGIAVERQGEARVTVAFHCWEEEHAKAPEKIGQSDHLIVTQGESEVGFVQDRVGTTDIGLAKLDSNIVFSNSFLDIDLVPKVLLPSADIAINDECLFDSFVTGCQRVRCQGVRNRIENTRRGELKGKSGDLLGAGKCISFKQGIYATGSPEIRGIPKIRAGVCGSAIVRVKSLGEDVSEHGQIMGFMHWSDLQLKHDTLGSLYCFADSVDELVDGGWSVVQMKEKRLHDVNEEEG